MVETLSAFPIANLQSPIAKKKASAAAEASNYDLTYFTLAKMITNVYSASDSISARPRMSAS